MLDMEDFDIILGMDWLASCHATLDCHDKVVKFNFPSDPSFLFEGNQSEAPHNLISALGARILLRMGCQGT